MNRRQQGAKFAQMMFNDFKDHPEYKGENFSWEGLVKNAIPAFAMLQSAYMGKDASERFVDGARKAALKLLKTVV